MSDRIQLLFVDDEEHNRNAFYANFRRKYQIHLCSSGAEGLKMLEEIPAMDMVITDQKMPHMTGIEFLERITVGISPIRIVVTAHRDLSILEKAKKEGMINDYYDKPWNVEVLERMIDNAINKNKGNNATEVSNSDFSISSMEEILEKRNKLSMQLRRCKYIGQKGKDYINYEIQKLNLEIGRRVESLHISGLN